MTEPHVAILVLNRNMREMTQDLIKTIRKTATIPHVVVAIDAGSDDRQDADGDIVLKLHANPRWAKAFAYGMGVSVAFSECLEWPNYGFNSSACFAAQITYDEMRKKGPFTHFWLLCNDTQLDVEVDTLDILLANLAAHPDACQIHPFQYTHPKESPQGYCDTPTGNVHNVAFVEFVCPLITRNFYDMCLSNFGCPPVNPDFAYGWGVDYEMAYFGHQLKLKSYICDAVGITHNPGTTHLNHIQTKVEDNNQMRVLARNNMLDVLEKRYGRNWGEQFANSARAAGVDPQAFLEWSSYDRALAESGKRI